MISSSPIASSSICQPPPNNHHYHSPSSLVNIHRPVHPLEDEDPTMLLLLCQPPLLDATCKHRFISISSYHIPHHVPCTIFHLPCTTFAASCKIRNSDDISISTACYHELSKYLDTRCVTNPNDTTMYVPMVHCTMVLQLPFVNALHVIH